MNLTNNLVDEVLPGTFANMTRLVRLILTRNRLSELGPSSLAGEREREGKSHVALMCCISSHFDL